MQIRMRREHLRNLVTCSDVRRIRRKTHGSHCLIEWIHNWSNRHRKQGQTVITRSVQWVCHAINKSSSICVFSTSIFRPQNYLAYACCMKPGCSEMIQSVSPHRAARNTSLLHHSILTTYYHTDTMLTSSLEVLHSISLVQACMQIFRWS